MSADAQPAVARCARCGAELPPSLLACASCRALVHADELKQLAARADERTRAGDPSGALAAWRSALPLIPTDTRQYREVEARIVELGRAVDAPRGKRGRWLGGATLGGSLLALLGKGKLLLLGLTKLSTLASMLVFAGVYWHRWGLSMAAGMVVAIYIHEMGHVIMLRHYGVDASAPMFIPGIGALVRLKQNIADAYQDARVGLAGPRFGLGASLVAFAIGKLGGGDYWLALAQLSAFINLFNLLPLGPLDGGRAFGALDRGQQLLMALLLGVAWYTSGQGLIALLAVMALVRSAAARPPQPPSWPIFAEYATLMAVLTYLAALPVPGAR
ncbi:MAG TPA: site-2 protease family protein [Polyangia bacterium]|nr:site-2 protease family protein [Polyangia bacterium]